MAETPPPERHIEITNQDQLKCFIMRFRGYTYEQIQHALEEDTDAKKKYKARTMELYFMTGGEWHDTYQSWRTLQVMQIDDQMRSSFIAQSISANQQIIKIAGGMLIVEYTDRKGRVRRKSIPLNSKVVLEANKDILDRAGYKPIERFAATDAEDIAERIMKQYETSSKSGKKK